jgi:hypothetical protein
MKKDILGLIPKELKGNEKLEMYRDGRLGKEGNVGIHKIDIHNGKRHYSISHLTTINTKYNMAGELVDEQGNTIDQLRHKYDIKRTPKAMRESKIMSFKEYLEQ